MTKTFTVYCIEMEFSECTAICSDFPKDGRKDAILIHRTSDIYRKWDAVCFEASLPKSTEDARNIVLNGFLDTNSETLKSVTSL